MNMLSLRVAHHRDESVASFCSRLAALNGRHRVRPFCDDFAFRFQDLIDGNAEAELALSLLSGIDVEALRTGSVRKVDESYLIQGQEFRRASLVRNRLRLCPACLQDDFADQSVRPEIRAYGRTAWLIGSMRTCIVHHCPLIEGPAQTEPAMFHDFTAMLRQDHECLATASSSSVRECSTFERYLVDRLAGKQNLPFLDGLPFYAAARFTELVGAVLVAGRKARVSKFDNDQWWQAGERGFGVTMGGEASIKEFLSDLQTSFNERSGNAGGRAMYGTLYETLAHDNFDAAYDPIRSLIREHAMDTLPLGPGDELFGPLPERRLHSVHSASIEFGVHPKRLRKLLLESGLVEKSSSRATDTHLYIRAEEMSEFIAARNNTLSYEEARRFLSVPRVQWTLLIDEGFVWPHVGGTAEGLRPRFTEEELTSFLSTLTRCARSTPSSMVAMVSIQSAAKSANCKMKDILKLLQRSELDNVGIDATESGFASVLVDLNEVKRKTVLADHGGISLRQVSKLLHASDQVVASLIAQGILPAQTAVNPVNRCPQTIVMAEDIKAFSLAFVSLTNLSRESGIHFRRLKQALENANVGCAFDPAVIPARYYRRSEIPPL